MAGIALGAVLLGALFLWLWRRRGAGALLVAAVSWLAYGVWEAAVQWRSPEADIRVDLLVFYPLLGIVTLVALIALARDARRRA